MYDDPDNIAGSEFPPPWINCDDNIHQIVI